MLLKSSFIILIIGNLYLNNLIDLTFLLVLLLIINIFRKNNLFKKSKKVIGFLIFYFFTTFFQIFMYPNGEVIYKIFSFYITYQGVENFLINYLRVINLLLISWLVDYKKYLGNKFFGYHKVIETIVMLVPEVITLFKKRLKVKWFFRHILKEARKRV